MSATLIPCFVLLFIKSENKMVERRKALMYVMDKAAVHWGTACEHSFAMTETVLGIKVFNAPQNRCD